MYLYRTGLGQVWVGSKLPPNPANNIIWLRPSDDHRVLWEIRTYNIYKERWEVLTSAALTADGLLILIRDLEKRCKSLEELKVVLYDTIQNLTPEEQKIARQNIGAISLEDLPPQVEVLQEVGSSTTAVMSQNAVTEELSKKASVESVTESISTHNTSSTSHADIRNLLNTCVGLPVYDSSSYKITFTTLAGASVEIDLPIEQLALRYNAETDSIEFDNADGTTTSIPVSAFVKEYVGSIGDRIQISIDENNAIHATVLKNSIDWDCLSVELQERINDHVTSSDFATKAVRTDIAQSLSLAAQNQALENIGADLVRIPYSLLGTTLSDEMANVINNARGIILVDTPNDFISPTIYNKGCTTSSSTKFITIGETKDVYYISYNKNTKALANVVHTYTDTGCVRYVQAQNLTTSEQDKALSNIGLDFVHVDYSLLNTTLDDSTAALVENAKGIILTNTPENYSKASVFLKSNYFNGLIYFNACNGVSLVSQFYYNTSTKKLTAISNTDLRFDSIRYGVSQDLTNTQKDMALSNIGLPLVHVDYSLIGSTLDDSTYNKLLTAKGVFLENVPDGNNAPSLYFVGSSNTVTTTFVSEFNARIWFVLTLSHTLKKLSLISTGYASDVVRYGEGQNLTDVQKQQARSNIDAVGSSGIKGVEIVYSTAPMQEDNILYIELEETT